MKISPELWRQISPLISSALELEESARQAWLEGLERTHPQHASLLREMLATHESAERQRELETVPKLAPPPPPSSEFAAGTRVGSFELIRLVGRGGMGEVWLAKQVDGRVEREVALKLPILYRHTEVLRERFRRERDILARLTHPNITRLFDAGVSDSPDSRGQPYLAMEYVEGDTLAAYAAARGMTIAERLLLFRQILAAVAHAHRHLVVHRDLKPANILIDGNGQVKLLDFGVAKLLDDEEPAGEGSATRMGGAMMTLRYAAPEQAAKGLVSTATDVYSLGVILHELVTGLSPHRAVREEKPFSETALLGEEVARPSSLALTAAAAAERKLGSVKALAREIGGDLDAIILKALRKDPAGRYPSVDEFDADLLRHLEHRPVKARDGTWRYLAGRFVARHRLPLAAGAIVLVAVISGVVMVEYERRVAAKHFASVRQLANSFMFDVHDEIADLPGALKAREKLVKTSLQYLDSLASDAGRDLALIAELAIAYRKVADIQGLAGSANLGELADSLAHYEKSKKLFVSLGNYKANDIAHLREQYWLFGSLARAYVLKVDPRWQENIAEALRLAERRAAAPGAEARDRSSWPLMLAEQAILTHDMNGTSAEVDATIDKAIAAQERLARDMPGEQIYRENLAGIYDRAGVIFTENRPQKNIARAIEVREKARDLLARLESEHPDDRTYAVSWVGNQARLAENFAQAGRHAQASEAIALALEKQRAMVKADPANANDRVFVLFVLSKATAIAFKRGDNEDAIRFGREGIAHFATTPSEQQGVLMHRNWLADTKENMGLALIAAARPGIAPARQSAMLKEACALLSDTIAFLDEAYAAQPIPSISNARVQRKQDLAHCRAQLDSVGAR